MVEHERHEVVCLCGGANKAPLSQGPAGTERRRVLSDIYLTFKLSIAYWRSPLNHLNFQQPNGFRGVSSLFSTTYWVSTPVISFKWLVFNDLLGANGNLMFSPFGQVVPAPCWQVGVDIVQPSLPSPAHGEGFAVAGRDRWLA